jgi:hypothetical protein
MFRFLELKIKRNKPQKFNLIKIKLIRDIFQLKSLNTLDLDKSLRDNLIKFITKSHASSDDLMLLNGITRQLLQDESAYFVLMRAQKSKAKLIDILIKK